MTSQLAAIERPQFALKLEDGRGHLVLSRRRVGAMMELDSMMMSLRSVPQRLDLSTGVERFRHTWANLEVLSLSFDDLAITHFLREQLVHRPLSDIEVRVSNGDIFVAGELTGETPAPFLVRLRLEPAGAPALQSVIVSAFSSRIYAPHQIAAPVLAGWLLECFGEGLTRQGTCLGVLSPLPALLAFLFAELGWKIPAFRDVGIEQIAVEAGRIHLRLSRPEVRGRPMLTYAQGRASDARFLSDYEAKLLFEEVERDLWVGEINRVRNAYERQLELHPNHPFLIKRLIQLHSLDRTGAADIRALVAAHERLGSHSIDTFIALAIAALHEERFEAAADAYSKALDLAEREGHGLEISQIQCAFAACLTAFDPERAEKALESALGYRRRLPGALRRLSALQAAQSRWENAIRTRERLLLDESSDEQRFELLIELGELALERGTGEQSVEFFVRASQLKPHEPSSHHGLGRAYMLLAQTLSGIRSLDQAVRLYQERQETLKAAELLVEMGDVWQTQEEGSASAMMRYRQALALTPGFGAALKGIARTALENSDFPTARQALEELLRAAENGQSDTDRFEAMLALGTLLVENADTHSQGIPFLQRCLDGRAGIAEQSARVLADFFERTERWHDLVRHYERLLNQHSSDDEPKFRIRLAELMDDKLNDPDRALAVLRGADGVPHAILLRSRAKLERRLSQHDALEKTLFDLSQLVTDPTEIATIHAERGDLLRFELNRSDLATQAYGLAVACVPGKLSALRGLVDLYREQERYGDLSAMLSQLAEHVDGLEQVDALVELSKVNLEFLGRRQMALEVAQRAYDLTKDEPYVLRSLIQAQLANQDLAGALENHLQLFGLYQSEGFEESPSDFSIRVGDLCEKLNRDRDALDWYQRAVDADPNGIDAYERMQDLVLRTDGLEATLKVLEAALKHVTHPQSEVFLRLRLGRLAWRELREAERAFNLLDPIRAREECAEEVVSLLLEIATVRGDWVQVGALLEQRLESVAHDARPEVLMHLAQISRSELDQLEQARQFAEAAVREAPGFIPGLVMLSELAFERHDWESVENALLKLSEVEGYTLTSEDLFRRAVAALHCGSAGRAVSSLRIVEMMGGYFPGMWGAYVEGYLQMEDFSPLSRVLVRMVDEEFDAPGTAGLLRRCLSTPELTLEPQLLDRIQELGLIPREELIQQSHQPPIVDAFAETRTLDEALVAEVGASFEAAPVVERDERFITGEFASWSPPVESDTDVGFAKTDAVSPVLLQGVVDNDGVLSSSQVSTELAPRTTEKLGEGDASRSAVIDTFGATQSLNEVDSFAETEAPRQVDSFAETQALTGEAPKATMALDSVSLGNENTNASDEAFLEFVRKMPSDQELVAPGAEAEALELEIEKTAQPQARAELLLQLAELRRDRLFKPKEALEAFWAAIDCAHPDSHVWRESVEALEDIYSVDRNWDKLVELIDLRIASGHEDELELLLIKAATLRSAGRLEEAAETASAALDLGERAVELLVDVLERLGRPEIAAQTLIESANEFGGVMGDDYRLRAAQLLVDDDPRAAYEQLREIEDADVQADALEIQLKLATELEVFEDLPDLFVRKGQTYSDNASGTIRASQSYMSAAEVCLDRLHERERAVAYFQEALSVWPDNVDALGRLRRLYTDAGDMNAVRDCLEREIELSLPGPYRAQLRFELASVLFEHLSDRSSSKACATLALEEAVSDDAKRPIMALLATLDGHVEEVLTGPEVLDALAKTQTFVQSTETVAAKIDRLENQLGLNSVDESAYAELASIYRTENRFEELASVLERHSTVAKDDQQRADLQLERAGIAQDHLRDRALARRLWERVIDLENADLPSTRFALISYLSTNPRRVDLERLIEKLNRRIEESSGTKRAGILALRAELWHRHLGETNRARADLEAAIKADEFNTVALFALARIAMGRGELTDASAWVRDALFGPDILGQKTVVCQVLSELRAAFVKQDELEDWNGYFESVLKEQSHRGDLVQILKEWRESFDD